MFGGTATETEMLSVNAGTFVFLPNERKMELQQDHLVHGYTSYLISAGVS